MRIIETIPHPSMQISIFQLNDKYLLKFEAAMMEQVFKYDISEIKSPDQLKKLVTPDFIEVVRKRFNEMYKQYTASLSNT